MGFPSAIQDLRELVDKLQHVIISLEELDGEKMKKKSGRHSMCDDEKRAVSARMRAYWSKRRGHADRTVYVSKDRTDEFD